MPQHGLRNRQEQLGVDVVVVSFEVGVALDVDLYYQVAGRLPLVIVVALQLKHLLEKTFCVMRMFWPLFTPLGICISSVTLLLWTPCPWQLPHAFFMTMPVMK